MMKLAEKMRKIRKIRKVPPPPPPPDDKAIPWTALLKLAVKNLRREDSVELKKGFCLTLIKVYSTVPNRRTGPIKSIGRNFLKNLINV